MSDIAVKALEWTQGDNDPSYHFAQSSIGNYIINEFAADGLRFRLLGTSQYGVWFHTLDEAKAAAQSDFDARIRSAIERAEAAEGGHVRGMREAIRWCLNRDEKNGSLPEAYAERLHSALAAVRPRVNDEPASIKRAVGECLAGMLYSEVSKEARRKIEKAIDGAIADIAEHGKPDVPVWLNMADAPKDGTMLRLLVVPDQEEFTAFDDSLTPYETIGSNNLADTQEDRWEFAGWDWSQDCFITGRGEVIGWMLFSTPPAEPVNPMSFFAENVDRWGAAEWFDRLAKAIREQDKAVVAGDDISFETYRMIAASSAMTLVRDHEATVRAALSASPSPVGDRDALIERLRGLIHWAHDTLYEIDPSDYDNADVCKLNNASVEVILGLAVELGEKHGKTDEWWQRYHSERASK